MSRLIGRRRLPAAPAEPAQLKVHPLEVWRHVNAWRRRDEVLRALVEVCAGNPIAQISELASRIALDDPAAMRRLASLAGHHDMSTDLVGSALFAAWTSHVVDAGRGRKDADSHRLAALFEAWRHATTVYNSWRDQHAWSGRGEEAEAEALIPRLHALRRVVIKLRKKAEAQAETYAWTVMVDRTVDRLELARKPICSVEQRAEALAEDLEARAHHVGPVAHVAPDYKLGTNDRHAERYKPLTAPLPLTLTQAPAEVTQTLARLSAEAPNLGQFYSRVRLDLSFRRHGGQQDLRLLLSGDMEIWTRDDMRNWTPS